MDAAKQGEVYLLTFGAAEKVMEIKGYSKTDSWTKKGYYFVRNTGAELKGLLRQYGMTTEQWQHKIHATE